MSVSLNDVKRVAELARIEIDDREAAAMLDQLSGIFGLIEQMQAVDTSDTAPMAHTRDMTLRLRDDVATEPDQRELFQAVAPQVEAGLYLVPKVIE